LTYGGTKSESVTALNNTADGGFIVAGYSFSGATGDKTQGNYDASLLTQDFWVIKLSNATGQIPFYVDADGDGYGNATASTLACTAPAGYIADGTDCNDGDATIHPNASDVCNSIDDNCNGVIDENAITATITPTGSVSTCSGVNVTFTANTGTGITYQWLKNNANISGATNSTYATSQAGNYRVNENNSFNCSSSSPTTSLSVISLPAATITYTTLDLCGQSSITLTANSGSGLTYQWKKGSNNINGTTNQS